MSIVLHAPAKINLLLRVLQREASGYHSLETLFCAISLADRLTVRSAEPGIRLIVDGDIDTGPAADNLVSRAAHGFFEAAGLPPSAQVLLEKRIPSAAGLGGGSSDAAATLLALNQLHGEPMNTSDLLQIGVRLGADVPFFLCGSPYALGWGRGERLLALPPLPTRPVLIAHPGVAMPTGPMFAELSGRRDVHSLRARSLDSRRLGSWSDVAPLAGNDFQPIAEEMHPRLRELRRHLRAAGAEIALLSGSGASVFGIFNDTASRDRAATRAREMGFACWAAETLEKTPHAAAASDIASG